MSDKIPFNNLTSLEPELHREIEQAVQRVLRRGWFVLGPEVDAFETAFANYCGVEHAVAVANGTDAIELALRAAGIGPGDEVITVAHTAVATVAAVERAGAKPVLVDIEPVSYTMDPAAAEAAVSPRTRALVPVHLYGHPADLAPLARLADRHGLALIEDCAQAHGARYAGRRVGSFGKLAAFSFYPTKNLGACGDGGAVVTNDSRLAERLKRLRNYGQVDRYHHMERGVNSRLDDMQAAVLSAKLAYLDRHNAERRRLAAIYSDNLREVAIPRERAGAAPIEHVYHLYVARHADRDYLREALGHRGIGTLVHYPIPVHLQPAYADLGYQRGDLPVTERIAAEILSLPLYVGLTTDQIERVAAAVSELAREATHVCAD